MKTISRCIGTLIAFAVLSGGAMGAGTNSDFDGDGKADPVIWRPPTGVWYIHTSSGRCIPRGFPHFGGCELQWGLPGDIPVMGDYSGDGYHGYAIYRPSEAAFYVQSSNGSLFYNIPVGPFGAIPAVADYDGDGKTDLAVFHPQNRRWTIRFSSNLQVATLSGPSNTPRHLPVVPLPADYDGDGKADRAVVVVSQLRGGQVNQWNYLSTLRNRTESFSMTTEREGIPIALDINGDGRSDGAVWSNISGVWTYLINTQRPGLAVEVQWGLRDDIPVAADYDGDGIDDLAVWRPSNGTWYVLTSSGAPLRNSRPVLDGHQLQWGLPGDFVLPFQARW